MFDLFGVMPAEFWLVVGLLGIGCLWALANLRSGIGIPALAVLVTILIWYVGDVVYNDYRDIHMRLFTDETLQKAWWQVAIFIMAFLVFTAGGHAWFNLSYKRRGSSVLAIYRKGVRDERFQRNLTILFRGAVWVWVVLMFGAIVRFGDRLPYFFFPFLGEHPGPWVTSGIGGGGMDALFALLNYLHMMVAALFGVVAALSTNRRIRRLALLGMALSWPHYVFHRTRGFILIVLVPAASAWVFLRLRGGFVKRIVTIAIMFFFVNAWFGFIIANRGSGVSIMDVFLEKGISLSSASAEHHQGLNMFEELSWIIELMSSGYYQPETGANYFANLVNPIPRAIWPSKPTIGLDYAIARGMGGADSAAGVYATLSNGLVGQGVVNFGIYFGAVFAGMLMGLWATLLARIDLTGERIGHLPLYALGLIVTFTLGRDITFINLYPFVFGYLICWWLNRRHLRDQSYPYVKRLG